MSNDKPFRYPGTRPFTESERDLFFGRDEDIERLQRQIRLDQLIVLFGKSGLGKSSLLNAGVLPLLGESNKFFTLPVRIGLPAHDAKPDNKVNPAGIFLSKLQSFIDLQNPLLDNVLPDLKDICQDSANDLSFWLACKSLQLQHKGKTLLLVFDQFEELFLHPETDINRFAQLLATIIYGQMPQSLQDRIYKMLDAGENISIPEEINLLFEKVNVQVLISIRSDKMSLLNRMKTYIPQILHKTYELLPLTLEQAEDALLRPASAEGEFISSPFNFEDEAREKIIKYLSANKEKPIEAFQLQLICQYCENLIINSNNHKSTISASDLGDMGDLSTIFNRHYENLISQIPEKWQHEVKVLIEDKLIVGGNRVPLPDKVIENELKIPPDQLQNLVNSRLLRCEPNTTGGFSYELSHDTLVEPILASAKIRKEQEEKVQLENDLRLAHEKAEKEKAELENEANRQSQLKRMYFLFFTFIFLFAAYILYVMDNTNQQVEKIENQNKILKTLFLKDVNDINEVKSEIFIILVERATSSYNLGYYDEAMNFVNNAFSYKNNSKTNEKRIELLKILLKVRSLQIKACQSIVENEFSLAVTYYDSILLLNPSDTMSINSRKFAKMLMDGYMVNLPGGIFSLGDSTSGNDDEKPEHDVKLDAFYMAKYEVTQELYKGVMGTNSSYFKDNLQNPVEGVTWYNAVEFCNRLSYLLGLQPAYTINKNHNDPNNLSEYDNTNWCIELNKNANGFRLPTEAEWEYAARGGASTSSDIALREQWAGTDNKNELKKYACYDTTETIPVGSKLPNQLGLYDMSGNVWEWCWDWYDDDYYQKCKKEGIVANPYGSDSGEYRVLRGGAWIRRADDCRTAYRFHFVPRSGQYFYGFRLVLGVQFTSEQGQPGQASQ